MTLRELVWMVEARNRGAPSAEAGRMAAPMTRAAFAAMKGTFRRVCKLKVRKRSAATRRDLDEGGSEGGKPCEGS
jgi:hypothetical protein